MSDTEVDYSEHAQKFKLEENFKNLTNFKKFTANNIDLRPVSVKKY